MFDHYKDAFHAGHFQTAIDSEKLEDGSYRSFYTAPDGKVIEAKSSDRSDAHRQVEALIREGVMNNTLSLGR